MPANLIHGGKMRLFLALAVFLGAGAMSAYLVWMADLHRQAQRRVEASVLTTVHAKAIERNVERALSATYALAALVRQSNGVFPDFEAVAAQMLPFYQGAASLQLAPGGVVSRIVPRAGNEAAFGHNLLADPTRNSEAIRARDTGELTLAGPFELLQGGTAAAGRLPVYLDNDAGKRVFWGFVTVLIRFPDTLASTNLPQLAGHGYRYRLTRSNPKTGGELVIAPAGMAQLEQPVTQSVQVPGADWTLSVARQDGWRDSEALLFNVLMGLLMSAMLTALADAMFKLQRHKARLETRVDERTRELAQSEQKLRNVLEGVEACIYIKDTHYRYQFANRKLRELYAAELADIVGSGDERFLDATSAADARAADRRVIELGETVRTEATVTIAASGVTRTHLVVKLPLRAQDGHIYALCGISTDITDRKADETALIQSESRYRALFADSTVVMMLIDPGDGRIVDANLAAARYYGYPLATLTSMNIDRINQLSPAQIRDEMRRAKDAGRMYFEFDHRLASGAVRAVQVSSGPIVLDGRTLLLSTVHDMTAQHKAEQALRESEARFRTLFESVDHVSVQGYDRAHRVIFWNKASENLFGYGREEAMGQTIEDLIIAPAQRSQAGAFIDEAFDTGGSIPASEQMMQRKDGSAIPVYASRSLQINAGGRPEMYCVAMDLSARFEAEANMREALIVFNSSSQGILTTDAQGFITSVNPAFSTITGYLSVEVVGRPMSVLKSGRHDAAFYRAMWSVLAQTGRWEGEVWNRRKSGEIYPQWLSINSVRDLQGQVNEFVGLFSDISVRKQQEEVIWRQANFDGLTGLANRNLVADRLERAMAGARRNGTKVGLLFLDLDGFKWINDTLGHSVGDQLLIEVASRLKQSIREHDTAGRQGGDEFIAVIHGLSTAADMQAIGDKVVKTLREPFSLEGKPYQVSASVGITLYPDDGDDVQTLLKNADIAMYRAKQDGKNRYLFYAHHMQVDTQARLQLEIDLRAALARRELVLNYQPVVDAASGELVGAEALIRWQHPTRGWVLPVEFIPVAEDCGLIVEIGEWVLREAARQWQAWSAKGGLALRLSVNVSGVQFREPNLNELVAAIISEYGIEPGCLMLEITESVLMDGSEKAEMRMHQIKAQGVGYALDDFGTGFSSLSYLKRFPIDVVKIDRSFVNDCANGGNDARLVEAIINMAHSLDLQVTAEGVETEAQRSFLCALGCDYVQGYLTGRPMSAPAFELLIQHRQLLPADGAALDAGRFLAPVHEAKLNVDG